MSHDREPQSDSFVILASVVLLLVILGVGGGVYMMYLRNRTAQEEARRAQEAAEMETLARAQAEMAMAEAALAKTVSAKLMADAAVSAPGMPLSGSDVVNSSPVESVDLRVAMNQQGDLSHKGQSISREDFQSRLSALQKESTAVVVQVDTDLECPFKYIAELMTLANKLGDVDISFSVATDDSDPTE